MSSILGSSRDASSDNESESSETSVDIMVARLDRHRHRKELHGGILLRPVPEYRKEDVNIYTPPPGYTGDPWYEAFLHQQISHAFHELKAWELFLTAKRDDWVARNEAAGGGVPPPPPVLETDPLELHTEYRQYLYDIAVRYGGGFIFGLRLEDGLKEHFEDVEQLVNRLRRERGLPAVESLLAKKRTRKPASNTKKKTQKATPRASRGQKGRGRGVQKSTQAAGRAKKLAGDSGLAKPTTQRGKATTTPTVKGSRASRRLRGLKAEYEVSDQLPMR